jgi:uncharacterized membrane protein
MNNPHLHLVVNHLPIIFPIVGIILLLIGIFSKSETTKKNSYIVFILGAIATIAAMATGESAEEAIEHLQGVSENIIKAHEESAEIFAGASYFLGLVSAAGLFAYYKKHKLSAYSAYIVGIVSLITLFLAQQTGNSGGQIRHSEIRNNSQQTSENNNKEEEKMETLKSNETPENGIENKENSKTEKNEVDGDDD